ncbi:hypothetical protein DK389_21060 [Methylobacterium durans]|uniref:Uncharacterized protein n=1 Tax=Methylobacterium durans TaxID=2202825 RepID=A0A2U8WB50_9HYPH|nr:hypothetical protein DK389_21060 [Methylobacterium durans]
MDLLTRRPSRAVAATAGERTGTHVAGGSPARRTPQGSMPGRAMRAGPALSFGPDASSCASCGRARASSHVGHDFPAASCRPAGVKRRIGDPEAGHASGRATRCGARDRIWSARRRPRATRCTSGSNGWRAGWSCNGTSPGARSMSKRLASSNPSVSSSITWRRVAWWTGTICGRTSSAASTSSTRASSRDRSEERSTCTVG